MALSWSLVEWVLVAFLVVIHEIVVVFFDTVWNAVGLLDDTSCIDLTSNFDPVDSIL